MDTPSRREVLAVAAATVTLPMLASALGQVRSASAATSAPATAPAAGTGRPNGRGANAKAPDEKAGWFATKLKPEDVKDGQFTDVDGHVIVLSRTGKEITALTSKCTHQGCQIKAKGDAKTVTCPCHGAQFNLDGTIADGSRQKTIAALSHYAIRTNSDGVIEIDPGTKPTKDDKEFKITVA